MIYLVASLHVGVLRVLILWRFSFVFSLVLVGGLFVLVVFVFGSVGLSIFLAVAVSLST